jgi:phospholipid/cholesterol/gamma-HCH transport system substrate-binding protein
MVEGIYTRDLEKVLRRYFYYILFLMPIMKITKEIKVGLFVVLGVMLLVVGYNFLRGFHPLKLYTQYAAVYDNVSGIVPSTQVTINGFKVGQVEKISLLNPGDPSKIVVSFIMLSEIKVPKGSTAVINSSDLLGTKHINIELSINDTILKKGDLLVGMNEESLTSTISSMVSPLKEKSEQVLVTLDKVLQSMNDVFDSTGTKRLATGINDLSWSLSNVRKMTESLSNLTIQETERLRSIIANADAITKNLRNNNELITKSLKNIGNITDSLVASDLNGTIFRTRQVLDQFNLTLTKVNTGEGTLGMLANDEELYKNLTESGRELASLLKDMQEYPARYINVSVVGGGKRAKKADKQRAAAKNKQP